jgi:hypothetical protein
MPDNGGPVAEFGGVYGGGGGRKCVSWQARRNFPFAVRRSCGETAQHFIAPSRHNSTEISQGRAGLPAKYAVAGFKLSGIGN